MSLIRHRVALVCVLNWGLGHATRSVPIIKKLRQQGFRVILASDGQAGKVLQESFPGEEYRELPGYGMRYDRNSMIYNMARHGARVFSSIQKEKRILERWVAELDPDLILSDNRYGCRHRACRSVLLTHQLHFPGLPFWARTAPEWWVNDAAAKFDEVWIPDYPGKIGLSGFLSNARKKINMRWIGPLTRLEPSDHPKKWDWMALISGVDPARSRFAERLFQLFVDLPGSKLLIEGRPGEITEQIKDGVHILSYANAQTLSRILSSTKIAVARAGYSTIMDLASFRSRSVLVPTPGQPEQEYLAEWLDKHCWAHVLKEGELGLEALLNAEKNPRTMPGMERGVDLLEEAIAAL